MHFEKISYEQWYSDVCSMGDDPIIRKWYNNIKLPKQGTGNSMGVDFFLPYDIHIKPHDTIKIPTGIRWVCTEYEHDYGLMLVPRSSIGIKYGLRLLNTVGVIDSDYQYADNEGHIMLFMENTSGEDIRIEKGKGIVQGIILQYYIPDCAMAIDKRNGGFGSTDKSIT